MIIFIKIGRIFYAIALIIYGVQQFIFGDFRPVLFPEWQSSLPLLPVWAYLFGIALLIAAAGIILDKKAKEIFLLLGGVFLGLLCFAHLPYQLISQPNQLYHLGLWVAPLKELALAGGAFVMAGTYPSTLDTQEKRGVIRILEKLVPYGNIFYSITIVSFGIAHCLYAENVQTIVPAWVPDHLFWTYFAAALLIGSGVFIVLNIRRKLIAILQAIMIFLWFLMLHLPAAFANPMGQRGNELASAFDALLFSGVALAIAFGMRYQAGDDI
jgi:uncharacterized membrane protein YphA (DoxX/SURF4 family)